MENSTIINHITNAINEMGVTYFINDKMSWCFPNKMRYVIQIPDLHVKDDSHEGMSLALAVYNSYDGQTPVKFDWLMYRYVCSNGMKTFLPIKKIIKKHYKELQMSEVMSIFEDAFIKIESIEEKVRQLQSVTTIPYQINQEMEQKFPKMMDYINTNNRMPDNLWDCFNLFTNYIATKVAPRQQEMYLQFVNQAFLKHI